MKKRTLLLVVPTLLTALVGTSCGGNNTSSSSTQVSSSNSSSASKPSTDSSTSSTTNSNIKKEYTYSEIESMSGSLDANLKLPIAGGAMNVGLNLNVPMALNYQVANEEIDPNKVLQYVKFHFSIDVGSRADLVLGVSGSNSTTTTSTFYGLANSLVSIVGALTGSGDGSLVNFFDGTPFAYGDFYAEDEAPKIKSIDFDYNADGKLYISVMGSSNAPVLSEESGQYEFDQVHSLGTTMIDINEIIAQVMMMLNNFKDLGEVNFKTVLAFLANINVALPEIEIDFGKLIKVISSLCITMGQGEVGIKLNDEGINNLNTLLASLIPEDYASFVTLPKITDVIGSSSFGTPNHYVLVDVRTQYEVNGFTYSDSLLKFEFKDTIPASNVFPSTTYEQDYVDTLNALKVVENVVNASENISYKAESAVEQNKVITETETALENASTSTKEKVGNVLNVLGVDESGDNKVFTSYVEGMGLLSTFESAIASYDADVSKWTDENWDEIANQIEEIMNFDDSNIIKNSYLTVKLTSVIDAYTEHVAIKEAETQAQFLVTSEAISQILDKYVDEVIDGDMSKVAIDFVKELTSAIYIGTDEVKPLTYFDERTIDSMLGFVFTEKDYAAYGASIKYVYDSIVAAQEKVKSASEVSDLTEKDFVNPLQNVIMPLYLDGTYIGKYFDETNSFNNVLKARQKSLYTLISDFNYVTEEAITYLAGLKLGESKNWVVETLNTYDVKPADVASSSDLIALNASLEKLTTLESKLSYILTSTDSVISENTQVAKAAISSYKNALTERIAALQA
jgi:lipoprotein